MNSKQRRKLCRLKEYFRYNWMAMVSDGLYGKVDKLADKLIAMKRRS